MQIFVNLPVQTGVIMNTLLKKLNYKGQKRIAIINPQDNTITDAFSGSSDLTIDREIDPRYPYDFMVLYAKKAADVRVLAPVALHNLSADGVLWFCYPKKKSTTTKTEIMRDFGWKYLNDAGFYGIRLLSLDNEWTAMRFRNGKYIKSKGVNLQGKQDC